MQPPSQKLHKILAQSGLGSRRDMETLIESGQVRVNGEVATVGTRISEHDVVTINRRRIRLNFAETAPRILLYHKPEGEIVSRDDPEGRASVFEALPRMHGAKWQSVGRLDFNTSGLLVFTTSGELANRLSHPRFDIEREYAVRVVGELTEAQMRDACHEILLEDGPARFERIRDNGGEGTNHWYQVVLKEGRNREVRRMFEAMHLMVGRLIRVRFGIIGLPPRLKRGHFIELDPVQVNQVLKWAGMEPMRPSQRQAKRTDRPTTPGKVRKSSRVRGASAQTRSSRRTTNT
jgi:23S rRNA pseudouridine2605 synthase